MEQKDENMNTIEKVTFHLHDDHLKLFSKSIVGWSWCEFGAAEFYPKKPYGNSSVLRDISEALGFDWNSISTETYYEDGDCSGSVLLPEYDIYFRRIHRQT